MAPSPAAAACDGTTLNASQLNAVFANPGVGGGAGYAGGDYQHVYPLPDGRKLWLFQDMFFGHDNDLRDSLTAAAHNAGLVQHGTCWSVVGGPQMQNFIGSAQTTPLRRWFWPMDGAMGADGALWIFMAEMKNANGTGATYPAAPGSTWVARLNPSTLAVLSFSPAVDAGTRLFGWSITEDDSYSYLYGHCYRQYIHQVNGVGQFDGTCMPHSYLARVAKGHFEHPLEYWTAGGWSANPAAAQPVMSRASANPMDVQKFGNVYVNVTKIDDWWGAWVYVDKAPNPWGPWEQDQAIWIVNDRKCGECGIYHAQLMPWLDGEGKMVLSWSNGAAFPLWQANAFLYRPSFRQVALPVYRTDAPVSGAGLQPRSPVRAIDTRLTNQRIRGGSLLRVPLSSFVAADAVGVVANVTAVAPAAVGYLTVWACGASMPTTSVLNYRAGRTAANSVHVRLGPTKELCVFSWMDTHLVVDITGSYVPTGAAGLHPVNAVRVADTQAGVPVAGPLAAGATLAVPVAGQAGVPANGVSAVTVTVTATNPASSGNITVWPCSDPKPLVSTLNFLAGDVIANSATVPLGTGGDVCVSSSQATHVAVDVAGWWDAIGLRAALLQPTRPFDSRSGAKPAAGSTTTVPLAAALPVGTTAIIANVTAVAPVAVGTVKVWSCAVLPAGASISYSAAETRAGLAAVALSPAGQLCLTTVASAHLLIDVMVSF
ncbi:MAG: hypothetical protein Q7V88_15075 [Actinomycetota bacterium]|nr:hypothetical protein [Actinomycetota bacterium]